MGAGKCVDDMQESDMEGLRRKTVRGWMFSDRREENAMECIGSARSCMAVSKSF